MEVVIQTKFNKGDIVDRYSEEPAFCTIECPFCGGKRYIQLDFKYERHASNKLFGPMEATDKIECRNCDFSGKIKLNLGGKVRTKFDKYEVLDFHSIADDGRIYYKLKNIKTGKEEIWGEHYLEYSEDD